MNNLIFILIGMAIWQAVVFIAIIITNEDEHKVYDVGIGIWRIPYLIIVFIYNVVYSTKWKARRLEKSVKRQLKKKNKDWDKWYKHHRHYTDAVWKEFKKRNSQLLPEMEKDGFKHLNIFSFL